MENTEQNGAAQSGAEQDLIDSPEMVDDDATEPTIEFKTGGKKMFNFSRTDKFIGLVLLFLAGIVTGALLVGSTVETKIVIRDAKTGETVQEVADGELVPMYSPEDFMVATVTPQEGVNANGLNPYRVRVYGWRDTGKGQLELCMVQTWQVAHQIDPQDAIERYKHMIEQVKEESRDELAARD